MIVFTQEFESYKIGGMLNSRTSATIRHHFLRYSKAFSIRIELITMMLQAATTIFMITITRMTTLTDPR